MKKSYVFILFISALLYSANIFAQGCEEPSSTEDSDEKKIKIIGYIQPQFEYHLTKDANVTPEVNNSNTFKFKRARVGISGQIPYDFSYYVLLETSPFVSSTGYPYLVDAFVSYRRFDWFKFSMGSFKQPFGLEVGTSCSGLNTIERALISDQVVAPQRDMGIMVFGGGKDKYISYKLALMNGTGVNTKSTDNNNKKDFIGRVIGHPHEYVNIGASFRYGYPKTDTVARTSFAADIEVKFSNFRLQAEYIYDDYDGTKGAGSSCGGPVLTLGEKTTGFWALATYKFYFNLEPVVKYERIETGNINEDILSRITIGANYFFNDNTRLQVNYLLNNEYNKYKNAELPNDAFMVQMQVKF